MRTPGEREEVGSNEAARLLGVAPTTVQRWVDAGLLPSHRTAGGHRRVRRADLTEFARRRGLEIVSPDGRRRVLVVDDERDFLEMIALRIRATRPDLEVLTAGSGFQAGYLVTRYRPVLVLLDIRMPAMSGIEVCQIIKSDPATAATRVVGITATAAEDEIEALRAAGAEEVHPKHLDGAEIVALLDRLLPAARRRRRSA